MLTKEICPLELISTTLLGVFYSKQIPEDSMSPVTTFEVPVSIPDPPVTTCEAPVGPAPPEKRPRTWEDMAAAAGVLIMTSADNEEPNLEPVQKKRR